MKFLTKEKVLIAILVVVMFVGGLFLYLYYPDIFGKTSQDAYVPDTDATTTEQLETFDFQATDISQWQEYESTKFNFSFRVPRNWDVHASIEPNEYFVPECNLVADHLCESEYVLADYRPWQSQNTKISFSVQAVANQSGESVRDLDDMIIADSGEQSCIDDDGICKSIGDELGHIITGEFVYRFNWRCSVDNSDYNKLIADYFVEFLRANGNTEEFDTDLPADFNRAKKEFFNLIFSTFKTF